jgi:hypothetical protein
MSVSNEELAKKIADLENELAKLKAQQVKPPTTRELLDAAAKRPFQKYDPTEGFRLPASAAQAMAAIVPDAKDVGGFDPHAWAQTKVAERGGFGAPEKREPVEKKLAWLNRTPLSSPPGVKICDQMMDVQDALDKRDLERRLLRRL